MSPGGASRALAPVGPAADAGSGAAPGRPPRIVEVHPLTPLQQGLLFHCLSAGGAGAYGVQMCCTLEGEIGLGRLAAAWAVVVRRHPVLRSDFDWEEFEEPVQVVYEAVEWPLEALDLRGQATPGDLQEYLAADRRRGFDLSRAPLARLALIRVGDGRQVLVWTYHHLLLDGWSALRVLDQVLAAYRALAAGGEPGEEEPALPFREYVSWLRGLDLEAAEAAWRRELAGFAAPIPLPGGAPATPPGADPGPLPRAGHWRRRLAPATTDALRTVARRHGLTLNTLLQGAWACVLARAAGVEDVVFGVSVADRPPELHGVESAVGLLINTLPVRVRIEETAPAVEWLARLQAHQLELRRHQHAPLGRIRQWSELPPGLPLFHSLLAFESFPVASGLTQPAAGCRLVDLEVASPTHYPLTLTALPGEGLTLDLACDPLAVAVTAAGRILEQLAALLEGLARRPAERLSRLFALPAPQRHQLLAAWTDTRAESGDDPCLHRWVEARSNEVPEAVAVRFRDHHLSYQRLVEDADRLAVRLRARGVGRGSRVAVCLGRSEALPGALLGVLEAGGAYLPLDPTHPRERLAWMIQDSGAAVAVTEERYLPVVGDAVEGIVLLDREGAPIEREGEPRPGCGASGRDVGGSDLAYLLYTSGSTGRPKGVEIRHAAVVNFLRTLGQRCGVTGGDRLFAVTTPAFDIAVLELFLPLTLGGRVVVAPQEAVADGVRLAAELAVSAATLVQATPSTWRLLLAAGWPGGRGLTALAGGEPLPRPLADRLLRRCDALFNLYGPTETTVWSLAGRVRPGAGPVTLGRPLANTRLYLLDRRLAPVPSGAPGALFLGGAGLARGYRRLPRLTAERFVPDPFAGEPGERLYGTGDLARYRPTGELDFLGRLDDQVKVKGLRIEPGEVEAELGRHPAVEEAVVAAREVEGGGSRLVAYLTTGDGAEPSTSELRRFLERRLPAAMVPAVFVHLAALPRTANGKLDRRALPEAVGADRPRLEVPFVAPRTAAETLLCRIWGQVLGVAAVGVYDDFFELGGDSIRSLQVAVRARRAGIGLAPDQLFHRRTVAELVLAVREAEPVADPGAEELLGGLAAPSPGPGGDAGALEGSYPLSPVQQGMLFESLLAPGSAIYYEQVSCTLAGPLRPALFRAAWQRVVARHPVLRSAFVWQQPEPLQQVYRQVELPWRREDWRRLSAPMRAARLERRLAADRRRGFDFSRPPLMRHQLIRLEDDEHCWVWSFHHALLDGWSLALVAREAFALYGDLCSGWEPGLPSPTPYRRYIAWLAAQDRRRAERFWRRYLAGFTTPTPLVLGRPRPAAAAGRGGYVRRDLEVPAADGLRAAARRAGLTVNTLLQGAWALLLARYSGTADVVFGSTSSGRPAELAGIESMVGLFVSTLPVRVRVPARAPLLPWLRRLQRRQAAARRFEHSSLVEIQRWSEVPRGEALFETIQVVESYPVESLARDRLAGLEVRGLRLFEKTHYPLSLMALPGRGLVLRVLYDRGRLDDVVAARLLRSLAGLLCELAVGGDRRLSDLTLLTPAERHQLLVEWSAGPTVAGEPGSVVELLADRAREAPDALAVADGRRHLTRGALERRSAALGRRLGRMGVGLEDRVALLLTGLELVVGALGTLRAGAAYVPLEPEAPRRRLSHLLDDAGAALVVTHRQGAGRAAGLARRVIELDGEGPRGRGGPPPIRAAADNLAYLIYTSGSSGRPKGVAVRHASLSNLIAWHRQAYRLAPGDRVSMVASPGFDASVWEIWPALAAGASLYVVPAGMRADPRGLIAWLSAAAVGLCFLPTPVAEAAVEERWPRRPALRALLTGGDRLHGPPPRLPFPLINHYGPTESTVVATAAVVGPGGGPPPIGRPIAGTLVQVLDRALRQVPRGAPGELCLGGKGLARGYLGQPGLTAEAFLPAPWGDARGERLYRTGDRVRFRADGQLEFLGRCDDQISLRGVRIAPGEIESALRRLPGVRQAAVVARRRRPGDPPGDRQLVAYVVPGALVRSGDDQPGPGLDRDQVRRWRRLYDQTYGEGGRPADPTFDTVGWRSSYSGEDLPAGEMAEWVDHTVERIAALGGRRVLEIGCGTGLLLFRLAPGCRRYLGIDFSRPVLDRLRRRLPAAGLGPPRVTLLEREADALDDLPAGTHDLVVLNSVAQYFPSLDYLRRVLRGAVRLTRPGGAVFVGDLRSLPLLEAFHASVELHRAAATLPVAELVRRVRRRVAGDEELVVDPRFFARLEREVEGIGGAEVLLKRGRAGNELTRFRYDVVLRVGERRRAPVARRLRWGRQVSSLPALERLLRRQAPASLLVEGLPNVRVQAALTAAGLGAPPGVETAGELRARLPGLTPAGIEPEVLWALADELGYAAAVGWARDGAPGAVDALFWRRGSSSPRLPAAPANLPAPAPAPPAAGELANDPLAAAARRRLVPRLRRLLRQELPDPMIPSAFVLLDRLPLTPRGKLDRRALPRPEAEEEPPAPRAEPATPEEKVTAAVWAEVLGRQGVGLDDSFFELGGHSLLAVQLLQRLREALGVELPLSFLFAAPTVGAVAAEIVRRRRTAERPRLTLVSDRERRHHPFPLTALQEVYWRARQAAPPAGANVWFELEAADPQGRRGRRLGPALTALIERHEMLRAVVGADGRQRILPRVGPYRPAVVDLAGLGEGAATACLAALRDRLRQRAGRSECWPLFDFVAVRPGGSRLRLLARIDALLVDGASRRALVAELVRRIEEGDHDPPPLGPSFRDCRLAVERTAGEALGDRSRSFWRDRLAELPPAPGLPTRPRPGARDRITDRTATLLDGVAWAALKERAAQRGLTASAVLLAAYAGTLAARCGGRPLTLGVVTAHRPPLHPEIDRVVGNFTELLPLAVEPAAATFEELARDLQGRLSAAFDHRWASGHRLLHRRRGRAALPVLFNSLLDSSPGPAAGGDGDEVAAGGARGGSAWRCLEAGAYLPEVLLVTTLGEVAGGGLAGRWQAREAILEPGFGGALAEALRRLLRRLAAGAAWR